MDKRTGSGLEADSKFLKAYSNKFDLETIFTLNLAEKGLSSLGNIPDCSSLILLDLTQNNIRDVYGLGKLTKLQVLKLGKNGVSNIESFKSLTNLLHLDLQGNQIKSIKNLQPLVGATSLQTLYLQTLDQQNKNPICDERDYRKNVFELLPQLQRLDGVHRNQQFEFDSELPEIKKLDFKLDIPTQYWYTKEYPKGEPLREIKLDDTGLKNSLSSCNKMIKELEDKLKALGAS